MNFLLSLIPGVGNILAIADRLLGTTLVPALSAYLKSKADTQQATIKANADIAIKQLDAHVELQKQITQQALADKGWWATAWMKPAAFYVSLSHYAAVVMDSLPFFGHVAGSWRVPALPPPYDTMEQNIILLCVGLVGAKAVVRSFK